MQPVISDGEGRADKIICRGHFAPKRRVDEILAISARTKFLPWYSKEGVEDYGEGENEEVQVIAASFLQFVLLPRRVICHSSPGWSVCPLGWSIGLSVIIF